MELVTPATLPVALELVIGGVVDGAIAEGFVVIDGTPPVIDEGADAGPEGDGVGVRLHGEAAAVTPFS